MIMKKNHNKQIGNIIGISITLILFISAGLYVINDNITDHTLIRQENLKKDDIMLNDLTTVVDQQVFINDLVPASKKAYQKYQILPSITIAQAILESNFGKSTLAKDYHNLFGIKAKHGVVLPTKEVNEHNKVITVKATFATYKDDTASVMDHAQLMLMGTSENKKRYLAVRQAKDYKVAASALQAAGYATDTEYAPKLVNLIESYHLDKYDPKSTN